MSTFDDRVAALAKIPTEPELAKVPRMKYVSVEGKGGPDDNPEFQAAVQALYGVVYTVKFMPKKDINPPGFKPFRGAPLDGLWWMADGSEFDAKRQGDWCWQAMIAVPEFFDDQLVKQAIALKREKKPEPDSMDKLKLIELEEGEVVQMMHIGPYADEPASIKKMLEFAEAKGYHQGGKHHEIYLGDPRRTKPERLRTVLRWPVTKS